MAYMSFLEAFYEESQKKKKETANKTLSSNVGKSKSGNFNFYDNFASLSDPEVGKQIAKEYKTRATQEEDANKYKERFFSGLNLEVQKGRLELLKKQAKKGDEKAVRRLNAIVGDDRLGTAQVQPAELSTGDKLKTGAANVVYDAVGRPLSNFAQGLSGALTAGEQQDKIAEAQDIQRKGFETFTNDYRAGKIDTERYKKLIQSLERPDIMQQSEEVIQQTDPQRFAAAGAELAVTAGGGALAKAGTKTGLAGKTLLGATEGALLGGTAAAQGEDAGAKEILTGTAIGGSIGGALGYTAGRVTDWLANKRAAKATGLINSEMDDAAERLTQELDEIEKIKDPQKQLAEGINLVDSDLAEAQKSGSPVKIRQAQKQQSFLEEEAVKVDRQVEADAMLSPAGGRENVSRAAARTEADAIEDGLTKGFDDVTTYEKADFNRQADIVVDTMDADYDLAKRIAMGQEPAPEGTFAPAFYEGVKRRARKEGDTELLRMLATESTIPKTGSQFGQYIASFAERNPDDPVVAMQTVLRAREKGQPKIPATISKQEAEQITKLSSASEDAREAFINGNGSREAYGQARIAQDNYVSELVASSGPALKESLKKPGFYVETAGRGAGLTKSLVATLDNSVIGRQGWKTLFSEPKIWAKNSLKSFQDIAKTYKGTEVLDHVHADMVSRDNALNGVYKDAGLAVYGAKKNFLEEAFPVSFQKVTGSRAGKNLLKPFKASEVAFTAWQQRTRADVFDQLLDIAKNQGVDITDKKQLKALGNMVNTMTSRGHLGGAEKWADGFNKMFFSPRLFKSNVDFLGGHIITGGGSLTKGTGSNFVRKRAARNLLRTAVGSAMALKLASAATGGKVETDPRSSDFGKVRVGNTRFDLAGGMAGLLTLGSRMITDTYKSSSSGEVTKLNQKNSKDSRTTWDVMMNFAENKLSPAFGAFVDIKKGEDFDGNKPTAASIAKSLTIPLIVQSYQDLKKDTKSANDIASLIAEGLGISVNTYGLDSDWNTSNTKQVTGFKSSVSKETFKKANDEFNDRWTDWYESVSASDKFWKLPQEERLSYVYNKKDALTKEVLKNHGYKYETPKKQDSTKALTEELDKYFKY